MHGPYPGALRVRVIRFVEAGGSRREAAEEFDVGVSSAIRWAPDVTLDEIVLALHKRRIAGSRSALSRFFARHGITVKKKSAGGRAKARQRGSGAPTLDPRARVA